MAQSFVDLMRPQQIMYNIASSRMASMMQDEAGRPDPAIVDSLRPRVQSSEEWARNLLVTPEFRQQWLQSQRQFETELMWGNTTYRMGLDPYDSTTLPTGIWEQLTGTQVHIRLEELYGKFTKKELSWESEQQIELEF